MGLPRTVSVESAEVDPDEVLSILSFEQLIGFMEKYHETELIDSMASRYTKELLVAIGEREIKKQFKLKDHQWAEQTVVEQPIEEITDANSKASP